VSSVDEGLGNETGLSGASLRASSASIRASARCPVLWHVVLCDEPPVVEQRAGDVAEPLVADGDVVEPGGARQDILRDVHALEGLLICAGLEELCGLTVERHDGALLVGLGPSQGSAERDR